MESLEWLCTKVNLASELLSYCTPSNASLPHYCVPSQMNYTFEERTSYIALSLGKGKALIDQTLTRLEPLHAQNSARGLISTLET